MQKRTKLTEAQLKVKKIIAPMVESILNEDNRRAPQFKQYFDQWLKALGGWSEIIGKGNLDNKDFDSILLQLDRLTKLVETYRANWGK